MTNKTAIEALIERANTQDAGYHVKATFPNGDAVNAPIVDFGPNWASFSEIGEEHVVVDLTGAVLEIDWAPGMAFATGERFSGLVPAVSMAP